MDARAIITARYSKVAQHAARYRKGEPVWAPVWAVEHVRAWSNEASPLVPMLKAWAQYADDHKARYESAIGDDGVLGPAWRAIGAGIIDLLNGELHGLDGGTMDGTVRDIARSQGVESDDL